MQMLWICTEGQELTQNSTGTAAYLQDAPPR